MRTGEGVLAALAGGLSAVALAAGGAHAQLPIGLPTGSTTTKAPDPPVVAPAGPGTDFAMDGADSARSRDLADSAIAGPFSPRWRTTLSKGALNARVFVVDGKVITAGTTAVAALDAKTGKVLWQTPFSGFSAGYPGIGVAGGRIVLSKSGVVVALAESDGHQLWAHNVASNEEPGLLVTPERVYLQEQALAALDAASGNPLWTKGIDGTGGGPALAGDRLFVDGGCSIYAIDRRDGHQIWTRDRGCSGGGGGTPIARADRIWTSQGALDPGDGHTVGSVTGNISAGAVGLNVGTDGAFAFDANSGAKLWSTKDSAAYAIAAGSTLVDMDKDNYVSSVLDTRALQTGALTSQGQLRHGGGVAAAGEGIVVIQQDGALLALGHDDGTQKAITVRYDKGSGPIIEKGGRLALTATFAGELQPLKATVTADRFPIGRGGYKPIAHASARVNHMTGKAALLFAVTRNSRIRIGGEGRGSQSATIYVYPRVEVHLEYDRSTGYANRARVNTFVAPELQLRGHKVALYLAHASPKRMVRLALKRMPRSRQGVGHAHFAIDIRGKAGKHDFLFACLPKIEKLGMGYADRVQKRCGRDTIKY